MCIKTKRKKKYIFVLLTSNADGMQPDFSVFEQTQNTNYDNGAVIEECGE